MSGGPDHQPLADELSIALVIGLNEHPDAQDRAKVCCARRAEILEGVDQIIAVLHDTGKYLEIEAWKVDKDQLQLCHERLTWAMQMATGLRQGLFAMKIMELTDCISPAQEGHAPLSPAEEYRCIENLLDISIERIKAFSSAFKEVEKRIVAKTKGRDTDMIEMFGESVAVGVASLGTMLWPAAKGMLSPLSPVLDVLLDLPNFPSMQNLAQTGSEHSDSDKGYLGYLGSKQQDRGHVEEVWVLESDDQ
jgi:hypothetical protein